MPGKAKLATQELVEVMHSIGHRYVPVIAADQVDQLSLPKYGNWSYIMNLDPSDMPGSQWIAANIDVMNGKFIEYYDPLGGPPTPDCLRRIQAFVDNSPAYR